jgi:hypothetical protein
MRALLTLFFSCCLLTSQAQSLSNLLKPNKTGGVAGLQQDEIAKGLKEALQVGADKTIQQLTQTDGFFGNAAIKILMPPEAEKIEKSLRSLGFNKQVDDAILTMNRAAEDAAKQAAPLFVKAIQEISLEDALGILKGDDKAATTYLQGKTNTALTAAFRPSIEQSLEKTGATKQWNSIVTQYNKFTFKKINPDLAGYVTEKSLTGIFTQIALEEQQIRKDPLARSSDLLKKVFGKSN